MKKFLIYTSITIILAVASIIYTGLYLTDTTVGYNIDKHLNNIVHKIMHTAGLEKKEIDTPKHGTRKLYSSEKTDRECPLFIIRNEGNSEYAFVKLVDRYSGDIAAEFFLHPHKDISSRVHPGRYKIFIAEGTNWYGRKQLFGKDTTAWKIEKTMFFQPIPLEGQTRLNTKGIHFNEGLAIPGSVILHTKAQTYEEKVMVSRFVW